MTELDGYRDDGCLYGGLAIYLGHIKTGQLLGPYCGHYKTGPFRLPHFSLTSSTGN